MKIPTEEEIIKEVQELKLDMEGHDFQMGISGRNEKIFFNRINKILRMLKKPVRRIDFKWKTSSSKIRRKS